MPKIKNENRLITTNDEGDVCRYQPFLFFEFLTFISGARAFLNSAERSRAFSAQVPDAPQDIIVKITVKYGVEQNDFNFMYIPLFYSLHKLP